jgi:asparagine synthase (glutamine-hydrolysing)
MCGIAGWLGHQENSEKLALRMAVALRHRGPDAHGIQFWPEATLVHTRLSIIDISSNGAQPMANEDGSVWTVFNGEIYNHRELRRDLENRGHVFKGQSDTEILPHLYEEHGAQFVGRLRGMFALAIYDKHTQTVILARDRCGIKPLFYASSSRRLAFASEINALLQMAEIDRRPDRQAIYDFAALSYIPAPETFYVGIRSLLPGQMLEACLNCNEIAYRIHTYHQWTITPDAGMTLDSAAERAGTLLSAAVRSQLESDVPLGALLSGGIDSSLASVVAQQGLTEQLNTFNVRFPEKEYDETWAALAVAQHIGSSHITLNMEDVPGSWEYVTDLLLHAGQPFADTSLFAANAVCRLMRRHLTVALSGDGGDEGFGGYHFYWQIARIARWQTLPPFLWRAASMVLQPVSAVGVLPSRLPQRVKELAGADDTSVIQSLFCWVREDEHRRLCSDTQLLPVRRLFEPQWEHSSQRYSSRLERLSAHATEANVRLMLPNDFLFKVDTASMKESLEVRVPMLDENLLAFGLTLPHRLKVRNRTCKRVLRAVAEKWLPSAVAKKPKLGFGIPVDKWVNADFKKRLHAELLSPSTGLPDFFREEAYRPIVEAFCDSRPHKLLSREGLYQRAIMLLSVHLALNRA